MQRILLATSVALSLFAATSAFASEGYLISDVTLRAGPDENYPVVAVLDGGTSVGIEGCVDGWSWCDVDTPAGRGWVRGDYLQEEYQGRRVRIVEYGPRIGIPFITFEFGNYWDHYYRSRPWYGERQRYSSFRPHYRHFDSRPAHTPRVEPRPDRTHGPDRPRAPDERPQHRQLEVNHSDSVDHNRTVVRTTPPQPRSEQPRPNRTLDEKSPIDRGNDRDKQGNDKPGKDKGKRNNQQR